MSATSLRWDSIALRAISSRSSFILKALNLPRIPLREDSSSKPSSSGMCAAMSRTRATLR